MRALLEPDLRFRIRTDRVEQAFRFLSEDLKLPVLRNEGSGLYLSVSEAEIAAINRSLVSQGFQVSEISRQVSSLEEIYFRLTQC